MKQLLILIACWCSINGFAQERTDTTNVLKKFHWRKDFKTIDSIKLYKMQKDSNKITYMLPQYKSNMPNAIGALPAPKYFANNGRGHNIYILPMDNMPMIKPDSSFYSKMPTEKDVLGLIH